MSSPIETTLEAGAPFRLGEWLVEPSLNRVSRGDEVTQLELKAMDVLVFLAGRAGEVVDKRELVDAVWQTEFVSDNTLTRRIAELRDALGDDARRPRYIETITKRGYRLIAAVGGADELDQTVAEFPERLAAASNRGPYPGLASFTEVDTEDFFGRGAEIAALWRKITSRRLIAVVGPSGVGKSSLLRAGVAARAPAGWHAIVCQPGEDPLLGLARSLAADFSGEVEEVQELLRFHDPDVALAVVARWRGRWDEALLVVDQFEELFTFNTPQVQEKFVSLLRRLVDAAGIHVVLVLRDDFLYECHRFCELEPVLRDLTLVGPPVGVALRRALTEPAGRRLHRFESNLIIDEMVGEVERERGALPLLAFAASRLWELRDRERRLLTLRAYERIGGVSGALAQHAEETLEAIGFERLPIVRELFRNLVTAQGTRAVRDMGELLSVFGERSREDAQEVLGALIDARLLTAFHDEAAEGVGDPSRRRVEIVHESLLAAWPRLLRWQTQDADAAQLRDQLRQAAQGWKARGRPDGLLWTGASYREYQVWREHYGGGLTVVEAEFAEAMTALASRRRRRLRSVSAVLVGALAVVAVTVTGLWQRSEQNARRVEARRLYQIGREAIDRSPPEAIAYAIASLELADDVETRRLALDALARSPMPMVMPPPSLTDLPVGAEFSPDSRWLSVGQIDGQMLLVGSAGEVVASWKAADRACRGHFTPDSRTVVTVSIGVPTATAWSVPTGTLLGTVGRIALGMITDVAPSDAANLDRSLRFVEAAGRPGGWALDPWPMEHLGPVDVNSAPRLAADPHGSRVVVARGREIRLVDASDRSDVEGVQVGRSSSDVVQLAQRPGGRWVASHGEDGEIELWSLDDPDPMPHRAWQGPARTVCNDLGFDPTGGLLAGCYDDGTARLWEVEGPPGAEPLVLHPPCSRMLETGFLPGGGLVATTGFTVVAIWPLERGRRPSVLRGHAGEVEQLAFGPDGRFLVSGATDGTVRYWPLDRAAGQAARVLFDWGRPLEAVVGWVAVSLDGRLVALTGREPSVRVVSIEDGSESEVGDFDQAVFRAAIDPSGSTVAMAGYRRGRFSIRMFELATGGVISELEVPQPGRHHEQIGALQFLEDGRLLASPCGTIAEWRPGEERILPRVPGAGKFVATPDGRIVIARPRPDRHPPYVATVYDLVRGTSTELASHGSQVHSLALDTTGAIAVTGGFDGVVRVGRATGETPHELVSDSGWVSGVAVSPDGRWIAAGYKDGTIRLWPMPDLDRPPLHELPYREFLAKLQSLTNLRAVPDPENPGSYIVEATEPFPGWESLSAE